MSHLLLHRLRQTLRALAQGIERAPLRVDGAVGVALAETALRLAHGFSGAAEVVHIALALTLLARLTLLVLAETAVLELFEQFVEAVAQGLLALPQVAKRVALLALLALLSLMTLLPLSALRSALGAAPALILDVVFFSPGLTMASFMEDALVAQLKRAEKKHGKPFPSRAGAALKTGRPLKA